MLKGSPPQAFERPKPPTHISHIWENRGSPAQEHALVCMHALGLSSPNFKNMRLAHACAQKSGAIQPKLATD